MQPHGLLDDRSEVRQPLQIIPGHGTRLAVSSLQQSRGLQLGNEIFLDLWVRGDVVQRKPNGAGVGLKP